MPDIQVEEIDVAENPTVAVKYRVMSTPVITTNGKLEFTGVPREEALLACLRSAAGIPKGAVEDKGEKVARSIEVKRSKP